MQIRGIEYDDDQNPAQITVRMTLAEAHYIGRLIGKQTGTAANEVQPGGATVNGDIYEAIVGGIFNRHYEDGIDGYRPTSPV